MSEERSGSGERSRLRDIPSIDYRELHNSGGVCYKERFTSHRSVEKKAESDSSSSSPFVSPPSTPTAHSESEEVGSGNHLLDVTLRPSQLKTTEGIRMERKDDTLIELESLSEAISDHLDENPVESFLAIEDIDLSISKLEALRRQFRTNANLLKQLVGDAPYIEHYNDDHEKTKCHVKAYIQSANNLKIQLRQKVIDDNKHSTLERDRKMHSDSVRDTKTANFLWTDVNQMIVDLTNLFATDIEAISNEELIQLKDKFPEAESTLERCSNKLKEFLKIIPDNYPNKDRVTVDLTGRYNVVLTSRGEYSTALKKAVQDREIAKEQLFKASLLNIKLEKFKGYSCDTDIYTFRSNFEKLHSKNTPTDKLADLLKNNHLANPALALVKSLNDIAEIWERLIKAYGDPKIMMQMKLSELTKAGPLTKHKDAEARKNALLNIINVMSDLVDLCTKHKIEEKLYHGDALNKIFGLMGDHLLTRWLTSVEDRNVAMAEPEKWMHLSNFLEKEMRIQQEKVLINFNVEEQQERKPPPNRTNKTYVASPFSNGSQDLQCHYCGEKGHVPTHGPQKKLLVQYFACEKFVNSDCAERLRQLRSKDLCIQCLFPGAKQSDGKHAAGNCQAIYTCKHESHAKHTFKKHVLVCQEHSHTVENQTLLQDYVSKCILKSRAPLNDFSKNIKVSFLSYSAQAKEVSSLSKPNDDDTVQHAALYMLQTILVDKFPGGGAPDSKDESEKVPVTLFFDGGCDEFVSKFEGVQKIGKRAILEKQGPITLGGVGETKTISNHGEYQVRLPLHNGKDAVFSGVCLDKITLTFPQYPLQGRIKDDIYNACNAASFPTTNLPKFPESVGGDTHFMIGIKYKKYFPKDVFTLPSGFTVCRSPFVSVDGSRGVLCGPHSVITAVYKSFSCSKLQQSYLSEQLRIYKTGYKVNPDCDLLKPSSEAFCSDLSASVHKAAKQQRRFEEVEAAGSEIKYRCVECRKCENCRCGEKIEEISIQEEEEQNLVEKSVTVDVEKGVSSAGLPFIKDPAKYLAPNKNKAMAAYRSVVRKLNKEGMEESKMQVIKSEAKLQELGFVEYVRNLSLEQQQRLSENVIQNFIPWKVVHNTNSVTTPCRIVFDASRPTPSSYSLNDILAKGHNSLNKLNEIFIRWVFNICAYHCDIAKAYNSVKLNEEFWCFQRYIFQTDLNPNCIPEEKVIKTLIYGVKPSGNQTECALRRTAELSKDEYPRIHEVVCHDMYMDDCMSGEESIDLVNQRTDELDLVVKRGNFRFKGFSISGQRPLESLSATGEYIMVGGMRWYPEGDILAFNISKKEVAKVREKLKRIHCVSRVGELFDLTGRVAPLVCEFKLDIRVLVKKLKLGWNDVIPDSMLELWLRHFGTIEEIGDLRFNRCVIPADAVNLEIETVDTGDASKDVACSAIYARILRKTGEYSCQLVFARTKLLPENITQPRAELVAAVMNAHTGEVVRRSLGDKHKSCIKLTDSQIVLHWLHNAEIPLKVWARNRVIETLRFTDRLQWVCVESSDMIADIGTRRGATIDDVKPDSPWCCGFDWMKKARSEFPIRTYEEVKENLVQSAEARREQMFGDVLQPKVASHAFLVSPEKCLTEVGKRYEYSTYIYDPNKYSFSKSVLVVSLVFRFIRNCRERCRTKSAKLTPSLPPKVFMSDIMITDEELKFAETYYFKIATLELKQFTKPSLYGNISSEENGLLTFKGRILPSQQINSVAPLSDAMKDLASTSFCVPIVDKFSPIALGVINDVHWNHKVARHAGVETVMRYVMLKCYIIDCREIVRMVGKACLRCRYLKMRALNVSMGPVSGHLTIAPAFYVSQVDIAGSFDAYSPHNKRSTIKIYFVIFCCVSTSTVGIRVMEDYTTDALVQAFIRQSCEVGYPKVLLTDLGSQLINASKSMSFSFKDIQNQLYTDMKVELETCPVGGHNMHGKVERKIRDVRSSIQKSLHHERLSILQWETLGAEIANAINDMPLGYTNYSNDLESLDILTPNRLKLGRNNDRSPVGPLSVTGKCNRFLSENECIFNSWFHQWLVSYVPTLLKQQKWFQDDDELSVGDVVIFLKKEGELNVTYQYGMIESVHSSKDQKIRTVIVRYRNHGENVNRTTKRAVRELVLIHHVDELDIISELGVIASAVDAKKRLEIDPTG